MKEFLPALFGLLGTLIGGGMVVFGQWLGRRQEAQRALQDLALKTAVEHWREVSARADKFKMPGHDYGPCPLDGYLIRSLGLLHILQGGKLTPAKIQRSLTELAAMGQALEAHLGKQQVPRVTQDLQK